MHGSAEHDAVEPLERLRLLLLLQLVVPQLHRIPVEFSFLYIIQFLLVINELPQLSLFLLLLYHECLLNPVLFSLFSQVLILF